jgi:hypothetical protein
MVSMHSWMWKTHMLKILHKRVHCRSHKKSPRSEPETVMKRLICADAVGVFWGQLHFWASWCPPFSLDIYKRRGTVWLSFINISFVQPLKNFPAFYGIWRLITTFTSTLHWSLSWTRPIQSIPPYPLSPRSITSYKATRQVPNILWNLKVHYLIHKSTPPVHILRQTNPVHTTPTYSPRSILTLSIYLHLGLPSGFFLSGFPTNNTHAFLVSPHSCYMPCPSHHP